MNDSWNRYSIISTAHEAAVDALGVADASLFGIIGASLAAMGYFAATQSWIAAAALLAPVVVAWTGITLRGRGRSRREIDALARPLTDPEIGRSVRALVWAYRTNERIIAIKARVVKVSGVTFLWIVSAGIVAPLGVAAWRLLQRLMVQWGS